MSLSSHQVDLSGLNRTQLASIVDLLNDYDNRIRYSKLECMFPDDGVYARHLYTKQLAFFKAGNEFKERVFFGGNRSGKSVAGAYEVALHATGLYPDWWEGKRFYKGINIICACDSHAKVMQVAQTLLCGRIDDLGSGFIPKEKLELDDIKLRPKPKPNVPNAFESIHVRHASGEYSKIEFRSYEAGRKSMQGTEQQVVWFDEEPKDVDTYSEALTRTTNTDIEDPEGGGIMITTFTPLEGITEVVLAFLPNGKFPQGNAVPGSSRWIILVGWDDIPHIPEEEKEKLRNSYRAHEIEARTKGIPIVGAGRVYITPEVDFVIEPFDVPDYWPRCYGLDLGRIHPTVALWAAIDPSSIHSGMLSYYIYDEYYVTGQNPDLHALAILHRGKWIPGVIDPSSQKTEYDGKQLIYEYQKLGLDIRPADNAIDAGITGIQHRMTLGKLKVFNTCQNFLNEYRMYRYDKEGKIAKNQRDDAMDAWRYLDRSGLSRAIVRPDERDKREERAYKHYKAASKCDITGY